MIITECGEPAPWEAGNTGLLKQASMWPESVTHLIKHVSQVIFGVDPGGHSITEEDEVLYREELLLHHTHTKLELSLEPLKQTAL